MNYHASKGSNSPCWVTDDLVNLIQYHELAFINEDVVLYLHHCSLDNRERKSLHSKYFSLRVSKLKNTKLTSCWSALNHISGMQPITNSENLRSQLHIAHINKENLFNTDVRISAMTYEEQKLPTAWKFADIVSIPKQKPITSML